MSGDRRPPAYTTLRYEVADAIATITLDRPEALNALTVPMKTELLAALRAIARDQAVRAVVLTGAGRAFCAGQDLKERLEPDAAPLEVEVRERYNPIIARDARGSTSRSSGRSTGSPPGPAHRWRSPATSGSLPRVPASCSRSGGSGSCPTAARRGSCRGWSGRPRPRSWRCSADALTAADAERFGLVARVVPGRRAGRRGPGDRRPAGRRSRRGPSPSRSGRSSGAGRSTSTRRSRTRRIGRGSPGATADHAEGLRGVRREAAAAVHRGVATRRRRRPASATVRQP